MTGRPTPLPPQLAGRRRPRISRGDLLYRLYLVLLLGGLYGGLLAHGIATAPTPALTDDRLVWYGLVLTVLPGATVSAGARFGTWIGPVPVTTAETSVLLPTPVDRRALLRPRLHRSAVVTALLGAAVGLVTTVLTAMANQVAARAWAVLPAIGAVLALLGTGVAAITQARPRTGPSARGPALAGLACACLPVLLVASPGARAGAAGLAGSLLLPSGATAGASAADWTAGVAAGVLAAATVVLLVVGRRHLDVIHDEDLRARAGLHAGVAASLKLGDLRAVSLSREPTARARRLPAVPFPRRPAGVVRWRHLTALRARPGGLVRATAGWAAATALVLPTGADPTPGGVILRVVVAAALLYAGTTPLLEPLRRDHDAPLAAELLPLSISRLHWLHVRASLQVSILPAVLGVTGVVAVLGAPPLAALVVLGPLAGITAILAVADRVRQPTSLAEVMAAMPVGATPEVVGVALAIMLATPLLAMLPAALPVGMALASPLLPAPAGVPVAMTAAIGLALLALRVAGLAIWVRSFEDQLRDQEILEPTSVLVLGWRRLRDYRRANRAVTRSGQPNEPPRT